MTPYNLPIENLPPGKDGEAEFAWLHQALANLEALRLAYRDVLNDSSTAWKCQKASDLVEELIQRQYPGNEASALVLLARQAGKKGVEHLKAAMLAEPAMASIGAEERSS